MIGGNCYNTGNQKKKNEFKNKDKFGPATSAVFTMMQSAPFISFLEGLTKISGLIPDLTFNGAGIHQTLSGGQLAIHADFNFDRVRNLHRRVNVFLFLNPNWNESYGGHLELWSRNLKWYNAKISPGFGKLVVFSTTDFTYHGHQSALACPENRSRRSLALYFYTASRPTEECVNSNCTAYHPPLYKHTACNSCQAVECLHYG